MESNTSLSPPAIHCSRSPYDKEERPQKAQKSFCDFVLFCGYSPLLRSTIRSHAGFHREFEDRLQRVETVRSEDHFRIARDMAGPFDPHGGGRSGYDFRRADSGGRSYWNFFGSPPGGSPIGVADAESRIPRGDQSDRLPRFPIQDTPIDAHQLSGSYGRTRSVANRGRTVYRAAADSAQYPI